VGFSDREEKKKEKKKVSAEILRRRYIFFSIFLLGNALRILVKITVISTTL